MLGFNSAVERAIRAVLDTLGTTIFPADCRVCGGPLSRLGISPVCEMCVAGLRPQTGLLCPVCGESLGMENARFAGGYGASGMVCTPCRRLPPEFLQAVAYGVYEGALREMIHLLKYDGIRALTGVLGEALAETIETLGDLANHDGQELLVVAVPLFRARHAERRFNQAEVLADAAIQTLHARRPSLNLRSAHGALRRVKQTKSQFTLTPKGRRTNVRGAFAVTNPQTVCDAHVLLIDDIYTTGATVRECARVLRKAGAKRVYVATLARAQTDAVGAWDGNRADVATWTQTPPEQAIR